MPKVESKPFSLLSLLPLKANKQPPKPPQSFAQRLFALHARMTAMIWAFSPVLFFFVLQITLNLEPQQSSTATSIAISSFWYWIVGLLAVVPLMALNTIKSQSAMLACIFISLPWIGLPMCLGSIFWVSQHHGGEVSEPPVTGSCSMTAILLWFFLTLAAIVFFRFTTPSLPTISMSFFLDTASSSMEAASMSTLYTTSRIYAFSGVLLVAIIPLFYVMAVALGMSCALIDSYLHLAFALCGSSILLRRATSRSSYLILTWSPWIGTIGIGTIIKFLLPFFHLDPDDHIGEYCFENVGIPMTILKYTVVLAFLIIMDPLYEFFCGITAELNKSLTAEFSKLMSIPNANTTEPRRTHHIFFDFLLAPSSLRLRESLTFPVDLLALVFLLYMPFLSFSFFHYSAINLTSPEDCIFVSNYYVAATIVLLLPLWVRRTLTHGGLLISTTLLTVLTLTDFWLFATAPRLEDNLFGCSELSWSVFLICAMTFVVQVLRYWK
ncbi:hypothetical protein BJ742DRAFT_839006 [Cladochytrium replicatum]|nr:hypothetical protein BJ742DRAFT_839006 [Cladochytrium replicatum]